MSEIPAIPDDVMKAARELWASSAWNESSPVEAMARAIVSERERILAEVAKHVDQITLADIASSIRSSS